MTDYSKHNIYLGKYQERLSQTRFDVPTSAKWRPYLYLGEDDNGGVFWPSDVSPQEQFVLDKERFRSIQTDEITQTDKIALILEEDDFWPVISFMSVEEAERLIKKLQQAIEHSHGGVV